MQPFNGDSIDHKARPIGRMLAIAVLGAVVTLLSWVAFADELEFPLTIKADLDDNGQEETVVLARMDGADKGPLGNWQVEVHSEDGITVAGPYEGLGPATHPAPLPPELVVLSLVPRDRPLFVADVNLDGVPEIVVQLRLPLSRTNIETLVLRWETDGVGLKVLKVLKDLTADGVLFTDLDLDGVGECLPFYLDMSVPIFSDIYVWQEGGYRRNLRLPQRVAQIVAPLYRDKIGFFTLSGHVPMLGEYVRAALASENQVGALSAAMSVLDQLEQVEKELLRARYTALLLRGDAALNLEPVENVLHYYRQAYELDPDDFFATAEGFAAARVARQFASKGKREEVDRWLDQAEQAEGKAGKLKELRKQMLEQTGVPLPSLEP